MKQLGCSDHNCYCRWLFTVRHTDCFGRQHFCPKFRLNVPFLYTYCFAHFPLLVNWMTKYQVKLPFYLSLFYQQHHCWHACHHGRLFFGGVTTRTLQERRPYGFITAEIQRRFFIMLNGFLRFFCWNESAVFFYVGHFPGWVATLLPPMSPC